MAESKDEFSFLQADADRWGIARPLPSVRRLDVVTETDEAISGLLWGSDPGFTFLHGAGLNAHTWDPLLIALDRSALALDLPGHGDSVWRDNFDYRPESMAAAIGSACEQLTSRPQTLVGHSLGGLTAIVVAADFPELVRCLVIVDISPGRQGKKSAARGFMAGPESYASRTEIMDRGVEFGLGPTRASLERGVHLNTRVREDGRVIFKHHLANRPAHVAEEYTETPPLWPVLERVHVPILLIHGTRGVMSEEQVREFENRTVNATTLELDASHNVQHEQPIAMAASIAEFSDRDGLGNAKSAAG
jgi:pimeloyl-ACP methyl ester carboxylesterase